MKKFLVISAIALATFSAFCAGTKKFGKMKDSDWVVTNAWQAMQHRVKPDSEWATNYFGSAEFSNAVRRVQIPGAGGGCDTNAVDALANSAVVTNALTVATTNRVAAHVANINNPHAVTAAQVGAVPLVEDDFGDKTAVTIGTRNIESSVGPYSLANGDGVSAEGIGTHAEGYFTTTWGLYSHASGVKSRTGIGHKYAYAWNGDENITYASHGKGTFNINPAGGLNGFYIGNQTLYAILTNKADKATPSTAGNLAALKADGNLADSGKTVDDFMPRVSNGPVYSTFDIHSPLFMDMDGYIRLGVAGFIYGPFDNIQEEMGSKSSLRTELDSKAERSMISATDPTFSNAVLAVGLNIDTNSVAVLNEIADTFGGFPIEGTATTVGGLLAALAAAAAWLKKNKVGSFESVGGASATVENGVAKLDDFFGESNSLLAATIDARLPYPLYAVPSTGLLKDRVINTTSLASVTVPDNFTDLLIRASVASSLSVTMPEAIATKYGDTFPGEAGEYLITITKTGAAEAYVRTIKLEVANA